MVMQVCLRIKLVATRKICCSLNITSQGHDISRSHELICRGHDKTKWTEDIPSRSPYNDDKKVKSDF